MRGCACHCLFCKSSNSVTSLSGQSVHYSQYPMVLAIVNPASGYTPFGHWLYWGGYWAGIALMLQETFFFFTPSSLICFLFAVTLIFFSSCTPQVWRGEWDQATPRYPGSLHLSSGCVYQVLRLQWTGPTLWMRRRSDATRRQLLQNLQQGLLQLPLEALEWK